MNYKLLLNEHELNRFLEILPDTNENFKLYGCLLARKKYDPTGLIKADRAQIKRFVSSKERLKDKIKQLEVAYGAYTFDGEPIPEESLALYISINPRDLHKAGLALMKDMASRLYNGEHINPYTAALNAVQTTSTNRRYFDVDIDFIDDYHSVEGRADYLLELIGNTFKVIETRGGCHVLIDLTKELPKNWYQIVKGLEDDHITIMMNGDAIIPLPGCRQGHIYPKLI